jgi:hypothetical protein
MSFPDQACEAAETIERASRPERGGLTGYTSGHVLIALRTLNEGPVGRPLLRRKLGLGEAPVKTMLARLESLGLVKSTGRGRILTERGKILLGRWNETVGVWSVNLRVFGVADTLVLLIRGFKPPGSLTEVYMIRDYLVQSGCRTALIGGLDNGEPTFPGVPLEHVEMLKPYLPSVNRGVIILAPRECETNLLDAAVRIILDYCRRKR